ncbi:glycosyltransferase [Maritimibacter sp. DP1N21-5]|uniref:glycosyltransferase n=1 Tax=Maritimibacter sp. DP1N21-5 TaxID=2836867 RepID=UPI001C458A9D|nr:glycosyltransferase [Maritimibacter sp. DP1N21-5]MBV7407496.1 glycosyltransferase [Maritimibacter sp. DP1N21-5]
MLLSTADWDNPFWTNKQHVALELARRGHPVLYVDSIGLRAPTLTGRDIRRIWDRLKRGFRPPRRVRDNLWVWSPLVLPFQDRALVRRLNRMVLGLGLRVWPRILGFSPRLLWTYSPLTTRYLDPDRFGVTVYHAVDDIAAQPGMPADLIRRGEATLCAAADIVFTTARDIQRRLEPHNPRTHYFSNVADFDHFNRAVASDTRVPEDLLRIAGPRIGFIGAISSYKLDFGLIAALARARPDWSFVFIGAVGEGDPLTDVSEVSAIPNIHLLGARAYDSLPAYLKGMDVTILPNRLNDYTRGMFPMKFFEYLASGRPVVSVPLPALEDYGHVAAFAPDAPAFVACIEEALGGCCPALEVRLDAAREQTYARRTKRMMDLVETVLRPGPPSQA